MPALRHTCSVMILHFWLMKPSQPLCFVPVEARVGVCGYILRYAKAQVSFLGVAGYFAEPVAVTQSEHVEKKVKKIFLKHSAFDWTKQA